MKRYMCFIILVIKAFTFVSANSADDHLMLIIHENLINDFFNDMGEIEGSGGNSVASYEWRLVNPYIEIEKEKIHFISDILIKVGEFKTTKNIKGHISSNFDPITNKIQLKIEEAKVIIDVDFWGTNYVVTELDLANFFPDAFSLNGPNVLDKQVEFKLPTGETRVIIVSLEESYLVLDTDVIQVYSRLNFKESK